MTFPIVTADQYKWARGRLGMSHGALAAILGISERTSFRYEAGRSPVDPTVARLILIYTAHAGDLVSLRRRMMEIPCP